MGNDLDKKYESEWESVSRISIWINFHEISLIKKYSSFSNSNFYDKRKFLLCGFHTPFRW